MFTRQTFRPILNNSKNIAFLFIITLITIIASCTPTTVMSKQERVLMVDDTLLVEQPYIIREKEDEVEIMPELPEDFAIEQLMTEKKSNGILITIKARRKFPEKEVSVSMSDNGYVNLSIYRAFFDEGFRGRSYTSNLLRNLRLFEFKESVQISLRPKNKIRTASLVTTSEKIYLSLFE